MKAGYVIAILSGLLALAAACGGEDDGLPQDQIQELQRVAAELSDQAGFPVVAPTYVPSDLRFPPTQAEVSKDQNGKPTGDVTFCFFSRFELREKVWPLLDGLCISENRLSRYQVCPPEAENGLAEVALSRGVKGVEEVTDETDQIVHYTQFCAGEIYVFLQLHWRIDVETAGLSRDMRATALRVAESIIEQVDES